MPSQTNNRSAVSASPLSIKNSNKRIIQNSPGRTGSTLLCNTLYGLFNHDQPIEFQKESIDLSKHLVVKTHRLDFGQILAECEGYDVLFVSSSRRGVKQVRVHRGDCVVLDYDDLCSFDSEEGMARFVANSVEHHLPSSLEDILNAAQRIKAMNERVEQMKDQPFSKYCHFYHVHGSHRNRDSKTNATN